MTARMALKLALALVFILAGVLFFFYKKEEFLLLEWPSATAVAAVSLAFVINIYLISQFNMLAARQLDTPLSCAESFMLSSVTTAVNFVFPLRAGAAFRAVYMKKVHSFPFSYFASTLAIYYLVTILVTSLAGMFCLILIYVDQGYFRLDLFLLFPAVLLIAGIALLARKGKGNNCNSRQSWWTNFLTGYRNILANKRFFYTALSIVTVGLIVSTIGWTVALREYAPSIKITESFLIVASQIMGGLATLTPGGTGFQELAGMYVGHRFQITLVELFAVLVWTKLVRITIALLLAAPSFIFLKRRIEVSAKVG